MIKTYTCDTRLEQWSLINDLRNDGHSVKFSFDKETEKYLVETTNDRQ